LLETLNPEESSEFEQDQEEEEKMQKVFSHA
jgi:hypothetical protein